MAHLKYPRFERLEFGYLDARQEAANSPDLLLTGYFDFQRASYRIANGGGWVLVGPKGSGKSAAFEHLDLLWAEAPEKFLSRWELASFPVADVTRIKVGATDGPTSTRSAWEFLILLRIFDSLLKDQSAAYPADVVTLRKDLVSAGLLGGEDLRTRFVDWSTTTVRFNVLAFGGKASVRDVGLTALQIIDTLRRAISQITSNSQHILAVDGLDSFFAQSSAQLESLGALLDAAYEINTFLDGQRVRAGIVLAIRHDMFVQVPSTDSAKYGDRAIELDWSRGGISDGNELWSLVNAKAKSSINDEFAGNRFADIRYAYLNTPIGIGRYNTIPEYFVAYTRLLPRDLIALLNELKQLHPGSGNVSEQVAREAVRRFSETYFTREISNGLSRVLPSDSAEKVGIFLDALSALPRREFNAKSLGAETSRFIDDRELRILLRQMFLIGGLGVRSKVGGTAHTNFYYRRTAGGGFSFVADYVLHNSLVIAWNIQW